MRNLFNDLGDLHDFMSGKSKSDIENLDKPLCRMDY